MRTYNCSESVIIVILVMKRVLVWSWLRLILMSWKPRNLEIWIFISHSKIDCNMVPSFLQRQIHEHFLVVVLISQIPIWKVFFLTPWMSCHWYCVDWRISYWIRVCGIPNDEELTFLKFEAESNWISFPILFSFCPKSTPKSLDTLNIIGIKSYSCWKCSEESFSMI